MVVEQDMLLLVFVHLVGVSVGAAIVKAVVQYQ